MGSCLSVHDIKKKKKTTTWTCRCGLATYYSDYRVYTEGRRLIQERPNVLQSEAHYKESQTKEAHVFCVTLNYITSLCTSRKRRSRSSSQKEIRRELQSIPKTMHIPSGQGCSGQSSPFNAFVH